MAKDKKEIELSVENIQRKVAEDIKRGIQTEEDLTYYLRCWFSKQYGRPLFHEKFEDNTLEELLVDFFNQQFRGDPEALEKFLAKKDETKEDEIEDEEWVKKMSGDGYIPLDKQEEQLHEMKEEIKAFKETKKSDEEFKVEFDEFK